MAPCKPLSCAGVATDYGAILSLAILQRFNRCTSCFPTREKKRPPFFAVVTEPDRVLRVLYEVEEQKEVEPHEYSSSRR
jgi:hypothetical protein